MEVLTQVPQTQTRLRIDADRQFEGKPGDATLRIAGEREGSQVFDATYVEIRPEEAQLVAWLVRSTKTPQPELMEKVAQELQATFSQRLGGRDAHQAAEVMWHGIRQEALKQLGTHDPDYSTKGLDKIAERFERASARGQQPYGGGGGNGDSEDSEKSSKR